MEIILFSNIINPCTIHVKAIYLICIDVRGTGDPRLCLVSVSSESSCELQLLERL